MKKCHSASRGEGRI